jgi:hypothetical protein
VQRIAHLRSAYLPTHLTAGLHSGPHAARCHAVCSRTSRLSPEQDRVTQRDGTWHNNHHAHPTSARHGLLWYEFDLSWIQIKTLKFFGLAKSVRVAKVTSARAEPDAA